MIYIRDIPVEQKHAFFCTGIGMILYINTFIFQDKIEYFTVLTLDSKILIFFYLFPENKVQEKDPSSKCQTDRVSARRFVKGIWTKQRTCPIKRREWKINRWENNSQCSERLGCFYIRMLKSECYISTIIKYGLLLPCFKLIINYGFLLPCLPYIIWMICMLVFFYIKMIKF